MNSQRSWKGHNRQPPSSSKDSPITGLWHATPTHNRRSTIIADCDPPHRSPSEFYPQESAPCRNSHSSTPSSLVHAPSSVAFTTVAPSLTPTRCSRSYLRNANNVAPQKKTDKTNPFVSPTSIDARSECVQPTWRAPNKARAPAAAVTDPFLLESKPFHWLFSSYEARPPRTVPHRGWNQYTHSTPSNCRFRRRDSARRYRWTRERRTRLRKPSTLVRRATVPQASLPAPGATNCVPTPIGLRGPQHDRRRAQSRPSICGQSDAARCG